MFDVESSERHAMQWLRTNHLDFFDHDARKWVAKTSRLSRSFVYALDRVLLTNWLTSLSSSAPSEPWDYLRHVMKLTRDVFINQRQMRGDIFEGFHDGHFWQSTFSRLWRGHVNCEGQNHLLAILLQKRFSGVELFETLDPKTRHARHSLVVFSWEGRRVFADAWSDVPLLHLHRGWANPPAEIANFDDLEARGYGERQGIQPRITYEMGRVVPIPLQWPLMTELVRDWNAPDPAVGTVRPHEPGFEDYLEARRHHLWGRPAEAFGIYADIARANGASPVARASALFAERLGKDPLS